MSPTPTTIQEQLARDEGIRTRMYLDVKGIPTIGIGHNLKDKPLTPKAIAQIFEDDRADAELAVDALGPWTAALSVPRRGVLVNLAFWLGAAGLREFRKMLAAMQAERWQDAAAELLDSDLPIADEGRAHRLATQLTTDEWT